MTRYATIITDADGQEIVSAIGEFEGAAPRPRLGRVEQVTPGVKIGMVRDEAGGFGFPQAGIAEHLVGLVMARLRARAGVARPVAAAKPAPAAKPADAAKSKRVQGAKKRARKKSARSKKPASRAGSMPKAGIPAANAVGGDVHD
ncbi:hypothetical protein [Mesorhizobium sp. M7A.F.Ca.MR.148.00.0.0]|uniref:hypothetical protein n=1 Tax=Mesorhizobium sp. M7A.F.Ca.MR.148.00.0.0 TaxID=2496775 RepID=UPI000FCAE0DF|nr:hypothetical protein [Mesorhizobium sp. M7A.F.Ca.MR.148.00.0.0]RUV34604.1 hypothetical protein EOB49_25315 [Mesorhizobium sp. M7A.F.Ca.MR.148.00.0.0]RWN18734.1 MAG: hypothetical protein EOR94_13820 [Mesorhizobium sp.]